MEDDDAAIDAFVERRERFEKDPAAAALRAFMVDLSETSYCAYWMMGLEFVLWAALTGDRGRHYGLHDFTDDELAKLKTLSDAAGGWVYWDEADECETFEPLAAWLERYAAHHVPR